MKKLNLKAGEHPIFDRLKTGRAAVCGLGVSNIPLVKFLLDLGVEVTARDKKPADQSDAEVLALADMGAKLILGDGYLDRLDEDVIFRTPGMRPDLPEFCAAVERGALIASEMELFFELTPATIIGITGSDGKTTTTTLTYKMLESQFARGGESRVWVGGNIGEPLLPRIYEMKEGDYAVVELSSFQLQTMKRSPLRAAITNITPNHLNWHIDMPEYVDAKLNICINEGIRQLTVNKGNAVTESVGIRSKVEELIFFSSRAHSYEDTVPNSKQGKAKAIFERDGVIYISDGKVEEALLNTADIILPGRHNVENYMTAMANVYGIVDKNIFTEIAKTFTGVEHRLEFVRELDGVKYYNSSIDSSPTRTAAALSALTVKPVVICGGSDKNVRFEPLAMALARHAEAVVLTGETAAKIRSAIDASAECRMSELTVAEEDDFEAAVCRARELAKSGGIVLLSPACASFDRFKNFMERGEVFKKIVNSWN